LTPIKLNRKDAEVANGVLQRDKSSSRTRDYFRWITCFVCALALAVFFRQFLESGFRFIAGNLGDNRLYIAILEHWRAVARGQAEFRSPDFYWPIRGALGYSDSLFLFSLPYLAWRALGFDPYIAFELSLMLIKAVGFFSMAWLLRSFVGVSRSVALVGASLFTLSNLYFISAGHSQLMAIGFVPLLTCVACASWRIHSSGAKALAYIYAALFGLVAALVLFTSFYIGWFAIFAGAIVLLTALSIKLLQLGTGLPLRAWVHYATDKALLVALAALTFSIAIVPFLMTYLPMLHRTGGRAFEELLLYSAIPADLVNIGRQNWMWGPLLETIMVQVAHKPMVFSEAQRGWPPLTLLFMAAAIVLAFCRKDSTCGRAFGPFSHRFLAAVLSLSFVVGWVASLKFHEQSLWWLMFKFIPGGSAIRVPARFNFVLNILAVVMVCLVLDQARKRGKVLFWAASILIVAEQMNTMPVHEIDREIDNAILRRVQRPPSGCSSFFLAHPDPGRPFPAANQIDAMLIARMNNLPTVNGYSGWEPADWHLQKFDDTYFQNVKRWLGAHNIAAGVCGLDLRDGSWAKFDFATVPYLPGSMIDFRRGGNANLYEAEGWGDQEDGGSWTLGAHSALLLNLPESSGTDLLLTFRAHAFLAPKRPSLGETLLVNGSKVADWTIAEWKIEKQVHLPRAVLGSHVLRIEFVDHDPKSPAELGYSIDDRKLGLALEVLKIGPVNSATAYVPGHDIDFRWGGDAYLYEKEGWGLAEDGGSWTLGGRSTLLVNLAQSPATDLMLTLKAHAFVAPKRPGFEETLRINGRNVADWTVAEFQLAKHIIVPMALAKQRTLWIEFIDHDPKSPADLGYSTDSRKLGLAIETLNLEPVGRPK
jgi:hypothetical protein